MSLPVAILAGGLATRLLPVTAEIPKALVEIDGRPFAEHQLELLREHGITDVVFLIGHLGEMVQDALGDGSQWSMRIRYVFDGPRRLGTGGALKAALRELGDAFFVLYGDSYLECDYRAIERTFRESGRLALMTVCRNDDRWDRSNVSFVDGRIVSYNKVAQSPDMHHIDYGLGIFDRRAFDRFAPDTAFDLVTVYQQLLAEHQLAAFDVPGRFYEIGSHTGLAETRAHIEARRKPRS